MWKNHIKKPHNPICASSPSMMSLQFPLDSIYQGQPGRNRLEAAVHRALRNLATTKWFETVSLNANKRKVKQGEICDGREKEQTCENMCSTYSPGKH
jgi:hypothetical protein